MENLNADVRRVLKKNNLNYSNFKVSNESLKFIVEGFNSEIQKEISELSMSNSQNILAMGDQTNLIITQEENTVQINFTEEFIKQSVSNAVAQSLEIARRRIDELGTREPSIQRQGSSRIIIQYQALMTLTVLSLYWAKRLNLLFNWLILREFPTLLIPRRHQLVQKFWHLTQMKSLNTL